MHFDNGLFALEIPDEWTAEESEDGNVYITHGEVDAIWISIEPAGIDGDGNAIDAEAFVRKSYSDKLVISGAQLLTETDGRLVLTWSEERIYDGTDYRLHQGLAAWSQSPSNLQMLMFQAACPATLDTTDVALAAKAFALKSPRTLRFHAWRA